MYQEKAIRTEIISTLFEIVYLEQCDKDLRKYNKIEILDRFYGMTYKFSYNIVLLKKIVFGEVDINEILNCDNIPEMVDYILIDKESVKRASKYPLAIIYAISIYLLEVYGKKEIYLENIVKNINPKIEEIEKINMDSILNEFENIFK